MIAAVLAFAAAPALALHTHSFAKTFTGSGTNTLASPSGVAVDTSTGSSAGDVYVADTATTGVEKFDSAGNFILMFGKGVNETEVNKAGSTEAQQNLCTAASLDTCKAGAAGAAPANSAPLGFRGCSSAGASAGDIYIGDRGDGTVSKFDSSGNLITTWAAGRPARPALARSRE